MGDKTKVLPSLATQTSLEQLADRGILSEEALKRAFEIAGHKHSGEDWLKFINRLFLYSGAAFILCGILVFIAYSWEDTHRYAKFAGVQVILIAVVMFAYYQGLDDLSGKVGMLVASLLVGVLMFLINDEYEIVTESYKVFFLWALVITGWAYVAEFGVLWLGWLLLLNLAALLFVDQTFEMNHPAAYILPLAINTVALAAWEYGNSRGVEWLQYYWLARVIAFVLIAISVYWVWLFATDIVSCYDCVNIRHIFAPIVYVPLTLGLVYFYTKKARDLFVPSFCAMGFVLVSLALILAVFSGNNSGDGIGVILLGALVVLGETVMLVTWLMKLHNQWELE